MVVGVENDVTLVCHASGDPHPIVEWFKLDEKIRKNPRKLSPPTICIYGSSE
jgi:hypothetical protein